MMKFLLILSVSCALSLQIAGSTPVSILDGEDRQVDLDNIAKNICWKNSGLHNQISRLSTIAKLIGYFEALPVEHQFSSCAKRNLALLHQLQTLLTTGNKDVCSREKLELLETFHYNYISNERHARLIEAPKMIKTFFMHYAAQISEMCANQSEQFFANTNDADLNLPAVEGLLQQYKKTIGLADKLDSYDDLFFVWGVVDSMPKGLQSKVADYLAAGPKRITMKSKNAETFLGIQEMCLKVLKPVYSRTLLPVMRLIDLGYYPSNSNFLHLLNQNFFLNHLYKLVLLCETSVPVHVIEGSQSVLVKPEESSMDESGKLVEESNVEARPEPATWMGDSVSTVNEFQAKQVAKRVAKELANRRRHIWRVIKRVVKRMKKSRPEEIVQLSETKESLDDSVIEVSNGVEEYELEDMQDNYYGDHEDPQYRAPTRRRREAHDGKVTSKLVKVIKSLCRITAAIIVFCIKMVVGLLIGVALFLATITGLDDLQEELSKLIEIIKLS